jgi:hypothetical protein
MKGKLGCVSMAFVLGWGGMMVGPVQQAEASTPTCAVWTHTFTATPTPTGEWTPPSPTPTPTTTNTPTGEWTPLPTLTPTDTVRCYVTPTYTPTCIVATHTFTFTHTPAGWTPPSPTPTPTGLWTPPSPTPTSTSFWCYVTPTYTSAPTATATPTCCEDSCNCTDTRCFVFQGDCVRNIGEPTCHLNEMCEGFDCGWGGLCNCVGGYVTFYYVCDERCNPSSDCCREILDPEEVKSADGPCECWYNYTDKYPDYGGAGCTPGDNCCYTDPSNLVLGYGVWKCCP